MVGAVLSRVTVLASVVVETTAPEFPARSRKLIENATVPAASEASMVLLALQLVGPPLAVTTCEPIVTVGVTILSDELKVNVTLSSTLAQAMFALFDWIETAFRLGGVLSKVTSVEEMVVATFPAPSTASKLNV